MKKLGLEVCEKVLAAVKREHRDCGTECPYPNLTPDGIFTIVYRADILRCEHDGTKSQVTQWDGPPTTFCDECGADL